jgi:hypothetical protein
MRHLCLSVTLVAILLAIGAHAQTPNAPAHPPVVAYNPANWKEVTSAEGGFTISMPGQPTVVSGPLDPALPALVMHLHILATDLAEFGVGYVDFPVKANDQTVAKRFLDGARDELLANGAKLLNETDITLEGIVGRELIVDHLGGIFRGWIFFVNGRSYNVSLATKSSFAFTGGKPSSNPIDRNDSYEKLCTMFFGSFRFAKRDAVVSGGVLDPITVKTDLFPADADAKKEIDAALKLAATDHKRVLLVFGGNWCYDCHVLDRALQDGAAGKIVSESFLLVHVDIGEANKNLDLAKQYKIPLEKGVPAVAILSGDGKLLYSSGEGEFEAARRMMKKDLVVFLNRWRESRQ